MTIREQIKKYIDSQAEPKRADINALHQHIIELLPNCKLWFLDGKDDKGKIVSNPNIGYGKQTLKYADGKTKAFYQIGISQILPEYLFILWALRTLCIYHKAMEKQ